MLRSKLGGVGNPNATSVIGDKNTYQATFTPNLNTLNDADPYVSLDSGISGFGIYDKLNLNTTFTETFDHEFYPTNSSISTSTVRQVVFQFALPNWTRVCDMYLSIPIRVKYLTGGMGSTKTTTGPSFLDPAFLLDGLKARIYAEQTGNIASTKPILPQTSRLEDMLYPDWSLLHIFQSAQFFMGNNSQPLGRTSAMYLPGIKVNANDMKYDDLKVKEAGLWGVPVSNMCVPGLLNSKPLGVSDLVAYTPLHATDSGKANLDEEWYEAFKSVLMTSSVYQSGASLVTAERWDNPVPACDWVSNYGGGQSVSKTFNLPIPLWMLNSFFKGDKMLPPDTKFKIDLYFEPGTILVAANQDTCMKHYNANATADTRVNLAIFGVETMLGETVPKLVMRSNSIKQDLQLAINTRWQTYPLLYNYETYEPYELYTTQETSPYIKTIAISQQRPTEIFIRVLDTQTSFPTKNPNPPTAETLYGNQYKDGLSSTWNGGALITFPADAANLTVAQAVTFQEWFWKEIRIKFQGRLVYWYRYLGQGAYSLPNEYDRLNANYAQQCYHKYGNGVAYCDATFGISNMRCNGTQVSFVIAPGGRVDTANLPADQGAQHIIVELVANDNLPTSSSLGKKIQIWKKLPEQISIDINKNVNIIMWPAIKSDENVMIASTVNTQ